jgi:hypothetical protein
MQTACARERKKNEGNYEENNSFHRDAVPLPREGGFRYRRMSPYPKVEATKEIRKEITLLIIVKRF